MRSKVETELNEDLHFLALDQKEQDSFRPSPIPVLTRFEAGLFLYKWTAFELVNPKDKTISQYWLPWTGFKLGTRPVPGFKELRMRYRNVDGSAGRPQESARARNAVTEQWNPMTSILKAELLKPVWGFVGLTAPQRKHDDPEHPTFLANVIFIGGDYQVCVPRLESKHIRKV